MWPDQKNLPATETGRWQRLKQEGEMKREFTDRLNQTKADEILHKNSLKEQMQHDHESFVTETQELFIILEVC